MNKQIIISLSIIAAIAAIAVGGTVAYFSDTETSTGNTFTAGTIDIAVEGENPWLQTTTLNVVDMKPSQHEYTEYVIKNVGTNPVNIFKKVSNFDETDGTISESECTDGLGTWTEGPPSICDGNYDPKNDISSVVRYDMSVWIYNEDPRSNPNAQPKWWQIIYTDGMGKTLSAVEDIDVLLGMLPAEWYMKVQQSYHMDGNAGNEYQGDDMSFDITLTGEQLKGIVLMDNKDFADQDNPTIVQGDDYKGELTYTVKDATFDYSFSGRAPSPITSYSLIFYPEPFSIPSGPGWPGPVTILGSDVSEADGQVDISGSEDFNHDILNMKVWLVETSDLTGNNMNKFNGGNYLFELGLMDYYDSLQ